MLVSGRAEPSGLDSHATGHREDDRANSKEKESRIDQNLLSEDVRDSSVYWLNRDNSEGERDAGPEWGKSGTRKFTGNGLGGHDKTRLSHDC